MHILIQNKYNVDALNGLNLSIIIYYIFIYIQIVTERLDEINYFCSNQYLKNVFLIIWFMCYT